MKKLAVAGLLAWAGAGVGIASATNALIDDGSTASINGAGFTIANNFLVNTPISIQSLGYYDAGTGEPGNGVLSDGLVQAHNVSLYDITAYAATGGTSSPVLLGTVTVPTGSAGLSQGYEYAALGSSIPITAGTEIGVVAYDIGGSDAANPGQDPYRDASTFNGGTDLTYVGNAYARDYLTSGYPGGGGAGAGDVFGAGSFQYSVPEPASLGLLSIAGLGLLARRRKA